MVAFALLRASLALVALLAPTTFSAPAPTKAVLTPAGYRPAEDVHAVPEGMLFNMRAKRLEVTSFF